MKKVAFSPRPHLIKVPERIVPHFPLEVQLLPEETLASAQLAQEEARVLREAEAKAREIIARAEQESQSLKEESQADGYEKGYALGQAAGKAQGREAGLRGASSILARLEEIVAVTTAASPQLQQQLEQQLVNLALAMAEKVVGELALEKEELVIQTAKRALKKVRGESRVTIRVNLQDLELVQKEVDTLLASTSGIVELKLRDDPRVERGGCLIETNLGTIDARLETQLAELGKLAEEVKPNGTESGQLLGESGAN